MESWQNLEGEARSLGHTVETAAKPILTMRYERGTHRGTLHVADRAHTP